jgi:hypothetical protein
MNDNSKDSIISSRPVTGDQEHLIKAFSEEVIKQSDRFDEANLTLLKFELGVPATYAVILKLVLQDPPEMTWIGLVLLVLVFVAWVVALYWAIRGITPQKYDVMTDVARRVTPVDINSRSKLTIEEFYQEATGFKGRCFTKGVIFFFSGVILSTLALFTL